MAYKNYVNKFYSEKGVRWDIEIWSQSNSSVSDVEFDTGKEGFKLSYKGGDNRQDITMPSEVTIPFIVSNAADETFIDSILVGEDGEHFVVIRRNFVIYWWGNLNAGFDAKENQYYPYVTTIKANDFIGEVINNKDESLIDTQDYKLSSLLTYYIEVAKIVSNNWDDDVFPRGSDELLIRTNFRWTAPGQFSYADNYNKLSMFATNPMAFESGGASIGQFKKSTAFKEMLKSFGLKVFLADGRLYCLQPYNYTENDLLLQKLKAENPDFLIGTANETVDNRQNAQNDSSVTPTQDSGFVNGQWILEPANYTDSSQNWEANGSCTSITSNKFNIALTTSYLYIDLVEGEYCLSYSENDLATYIEKFEGGSASTLLSESGQINFTVGSGGAELRVRSSSTGDVFVEYIGLQKGKFFNRQFLSGSSWRYDRPISKVLSRFNSGISSGQAMSNFPVNNNGVTILASQSIYTTLTGIGSIASTSNDVITMNLNLYYGEKFDYLSAINSVTHIGGVITAKLKIGSLYLTGDVNGTLSWAGTDSTFTINIPIDEPTNLNYQPGSIADDFLYPNTYVFNSNLPNTAPYFTGSGTEAYIGANYPVTLPSLSSGGSIQLQFISSTINYYDDPDTSNPNVTPTALTVTKNNLQTKFFTGLHSDTYGLYTSVGNSFTQYLTITSTAPNESGNGIEYSSSTGLENYKTVDLGTLSLGLTGTEDTNINCIKRLDSSSNYTTPTYLQVDNAGSQFNMTTLLLEQYLEPQIKPLEILQGEYYVNDFSAFKSVVLSGSKYVFFEGTLTASNDTVSGSWYKISTSSEVITSVDSGPIIVPNETEDIFGKASIETPNIIGSIVSGITNNDVNIKNWFKYNSIGVSDAAISSLDTKVGLANNSRCKLYNGQKLIFARPDLSHPIILTKSGDSTTSDTSIDVSSFTTDVTYPKGSILAIAQYDLTNVITGGGGSTSPGGSNTQVQFNDGGSFGGDSALTYNKTTDTLTTTNLSITGKLLPAITSIKILPRDFIANQGGRPVMIDESGTDRWVESFSSLTIYASVSIPPGFKATEVKIYGNDTQPFKALLLNVDSKSATSKGTGNVGTVLNIQDVDSTSTNYLLIELQQSSTSEVYGGLVTIAQI